MRLLVGLIFILPLVTQSQEAMPLSGPMRMISSAPPDSLFDVDLEFTEPVRLSEIRETAAYLGIPSALVFVEHDLGDGTRGPLVLPARIGVLYAHTWMSEWCQLRIAAINAGADSLLAATPENWLVSSMRVVGSAYAIRELSAGTLLPPMRVVRGSARNQGSLETIKSIAENTVASPVPVSDLSAVPAQCQALATPIHGAVLYGERISRASESQEDGDDFRASVLRQLAAMTPDTPLTLALKFKDAMTLDELAAMVSDYRIDGLEAMLSPTSHEEKLGLSAEISIHGEPIANQLRSTRCRIDFAAEGLSLPFDWYARSANVSLAAGSVYLLLSDRSLADARISSQSAPGDLALLAEYYRQPPGARSLFASEHPCFR